MDLIHGAAGLAEMVLFGVKGGMAAGTVVGLADLLFGFAVDATDTSSDSDDKHELDEIAAGIARLPKELDDVVKADLVNQELTDALNHILTYSSWMASQGSLERRTDAHWKQHEGAWDDIEKYVVDALDPSSPLLQTISSLKNDAVLSQPPDDFALQAFPVLTLGIGVHLLLVRARILLSTDATTFKSPFSVDMVNLAKDYLARVVWIDDHIHGCFKTRLDAISAVHDAELTLAFSPKDSFFGSIQSISGVPVRYFVDGATTAPAASNPNWAISDDWLQEASSYTDQVLSYWESSYPPQTDVDSDKAGLLHGWTPPITTVWYADAHPDDRPHTDYVAKISGQLQTLHRYPMSRQADVSSLRKNLAATVEEFSALVD